MTRVICGYKDILTPTPTITVTPTSIINPTPTLGSIEEELMMYGVTLTGNMGAWTSTRRETILKAVKVIAERFSGVIGGSPENAFINIYEYFSIEWCFSECSTGFGIVSSDDLIRFDGFYMRDGMYSTSAEKNVRLVTHELGHLFDRKVCSYNTGAKCNYIWTDSARYELSVEWDKKEWFCTKEWSCLSRNGYDIEGQGIFWGFKGGWSDWQFGATDDPGEVWADMFLGWTYNAWNKDRYGFGEKKKEYMDKYVIKYINELKHLDEDL
jgi:predicted Zn-dependent protease